MKKLLNLACYHGSRLPDNSQGAKFHWNGKSCCDFKLSGIKCVSENEFRAVYDCKWCRKSWSTDEWEKVLSCLYDEVLKTRLINDYSNVKEIDKINNNHLV